MADETHKTKHPIFYMIIRLAIIYTAATCFFRAWQFWLNEEYLQAVVWFLISLSQIGQVLNLSGYNSKTVTLAIWIPLGLSMILYVVSTML